MNSKIIHEIAGIIGVTRNWKFRKLTAEEIIRTYEFKRFCRKNPEICRAAGVEA